MTTTTSVSSGGVLVPVADPLFTHAEGLALAGFLSGYSGLTRDAYTLDLRQYTGWCTRHGLHLFAAKRMDIEGFRGDMEAAGRARATIARRLCTIAGFYRYAVEKELLEHSPAVHVRRPRLDYESHATALDRNELGALLVAAGLGTAQEHALLSLLALNELRINEALGADITAMASERGHRTLTVLRKGGKIVTIPLAPRTARSLDLAIGERLDGPIFLRADGQRLDRHDAARIARRIAKRARIAKVISPHTLRHAPRPAQRFSARGETRGSVLWVGDGLTLVGELVDQRNGGPVCLELDVKVEAGERKFDVDKLTANPTDLRPHRAERPFDPASLDPPAPRQISGETAESPASGPGPELLT